MQSLTNDIVIYIFRLIHYDNVSKLNAEYRGLFLKLDPIIAASSVGVQFKVENSTIKSARRNFIFNYRSRLQFLNGIYNIKHQNRVCPLPDNYSL